MPGVPVAWEAEGGESLEPRRSRLQGAEITPLHSSLGDRTRLCLKKKKEKERWIIHSSKLNGHWRMGGLTERSACEEGYDGDNGVTHMDVCGRTFPAEKLANARP